MPPSRWTRIGDVVWLLGWGVLSSLWCVTAGQQLGATFDEPTYVGRGLERWRSGSTTALMQLGTMPLPVDVQTLPLYLWERCRGVPFDPERDLPRLLPWARAGTLVFWWLLLVYAWLAARSLGGPWAGRLAVPLVACEPSLLAHAALSTTDVAITACLLGLVYHFRMGREATWPRRVGLPALWFAAAVLAKASGLVFGVICLVAVELERRLALARQAGERPGPAALWRTPAGSRGPLRRDLFQIVGIGLVLVFVYCGSDWQPQASLLAWARRLEPNFFGRTMVAVIEHLPFFSNAGEGLMRQVTHNIRGHGAYLLGQTDRRALWYYFPVVLSIKLSAPLLLLPLLIAAVRVRALTNWSCAAALALLAFSVACRVQLGVRFMLPLVALAAVGLSGALVRAAREAGPGRRRLLAAGVVGGLLWTAGAAGRVWPHGLCYVNEFWGGTATGYRLVSDANYDWGQGLKELARWQQERGKKDLTVWYFGTDPSLKTLSVRPVPLHSQALRGEGGVLPQLRGRTLAVSTSLLYGPLSGPHLDEARAFLTSLTPVERTTTFLIYQIPPHEPEATAVASAGRTKSESFADLWRRLVQAVRGPYPPPLAAIPWPATAQRQGPGAPREK